LVPQVSFLTIFHGFPSQLQTILSLLHRLAAAAVPSSIITVAIAAVSFYFTSISAAEALLLCPLFPSESSSLSPHRSSGNINNEDR
jgi:hypothetical protein